MIRSMDTLYVCQMEIIVDCRVNPSDTLVLGANSVENYHKRRQCVRLCGLIFTVGEPIVEN